MAHGAGGKASRWLVEGLFAPLLFGASAEPLGDAAHLNINGTRIAITTDSFVVKPLSFPGGSIGELAVNGTVNDLAVSGARSVRIHALCSSLSKRLPVPQVLLFDGCAIPLAVELPLRSTNWREIVIWRCFCLRTEYRSATRCVAHASCSAWILCISRM